METNLNFNSQICTNKNQSERLLALGLKKETADMYLQSVLNDEWSPFVPIAFPYSDRPEEIIAPDVVNVIPAWSLHRLIEMMPKSIYHNKVDWYKVIYNSSVCYERCEYSCYRSCEIDLYVDIINCIEWLIKEGYFDKEYLERKE